MKKLGFIICLGLFPVLLSAQGKFLTKDAKINFNSSTPVEDIIAETSQATSIIDTDKNEVVFSVLTTSFKFRRALMEEHFNENYMESPKFPKAKFSGKIITPVDWKSEKSVVADIEGDLTMHGVTKPVKCKATITPSKGKIEASAELVITPEMFNINIPMAVRDKVAKDVKIKITGVYAPFVQ